MGSPGAVLARLQSLPTMGSGCYPTPLQLAARFRRALGCREAPEIWIKRDDLTGAGFGGNKVRKLDLLLADAMQRGCDAVITCGGEASNHARVTAAQCARAGLPCYLVLNRADQQGTPASLFLDELYGAQITRVDTRQARQPAMDALAASLRAQGRSPYLIPLGASTPLGALGYVLAVYELSAQPCDGPFTHFFCASSSGGTQAGLLAGCHWFHPTARVIGVSPDEPAPSLAAQVQRLAQGVALRLQVEWTPAVEVIDGYIGPGYGVPTPEGEEALRLLARTEAIVLDPTYTAKAMAALIDWVRSGRLGSRDRVLFWHTGGQLALFRR